jgi:hypothetical protein
MKTVTIVFLFFFSLNGLLAQVNPDSGLIAYYPFNGNANDESGNNNHGTIYGAILTTDMKGNDSSAYEFNGTSSYISIPNSTSLQSPSTELTQIAWINIYSWSLVGQPFGPILMKSNSGTNAFSYRLSVGPSGINTAINNWGNAVIITDTLNYNEWYMIASTLKNDTVKTYVNGIYIGSGVLNGPINPDSRPLEIGRDTPGEIEIFHGKIDEIRIYNRALSESEIQDIYYGITGIREQSATIDEYNLIYNYPNPFNPVTTIRYRLTKDKKVKIEVFDLNGKTIKILVNRRMAAGTHEIEFNAANLPSGIYFYRMTAGTSHKIGKMILLK